MNNFFKKIQNNSLIYRLLVFFIIIYFILNFLPNFLRENIQSEKINSRLHPFLNFFFTPNDFNIPIASVELIPEKEDYNFNFKHKYCGNYLIRIEVNDLSLWNIFPVKYMPDDFLDFKITIFKNDIMILSKNLKPLSPYTYMGKSGLTYLYYKVPEELPYNKTIKATVSINGNIKNFINKYGNAKLLITKGSDE